MKKELLKEIIKKKNNKTEFAIITNLNDGESCIYQKDKPLSKNFEIYKKNIDFYFNKKKNGIIKETNIFVETYTKPIKVIIVGAVHIAQYLAKFAKDLNFDIFIIDPRSDFASKKRFLKLKLLINGPTKLFLKLKLTAIQL